MDLSDLNEQQRQAVEHDAGPLLVVAGAGTGKTRVITQRVAYLIEKGRATADQILALTFTDKAAAEMEERVDLLLPYGVVETNIMTFHSFGDRVLKEYSLDIGLDPHAKLMSKTQQIIFLKEHFDELKFRYFAPIGRPDSYLGSLTTFFSRLKEELIKPEAYTAFAEDIKKRAQAPEELSEAEKQQELAFAYAKYVELTRQEGLIDFGDQISLVIELLEQRPNVLKALRDRFRYIMVDEFQDTNVAQNRLLELLASEDGNIMVVGDDDQSIYKFRGAAISNILSFTAHFKTAKQVVLTQNYRSSQEILDAAYRLIQNNNPERLEVRNKIDKYLTAQTSGPMPSLLITDSYSQEADMIAQAIKERIGRSETADDIAILVRKRSQGNLITQALAAKGVPYRFSAQQSLYDQPEVAIILDFLRYITNPADSESLYHLLSSDIYNTPLARLMAAAATARRQNKSLEEILFANEDADEITVAFKAQVRQWRELSKTYTVGQLVFNFLETSGYLEGLINDSRTNPATEAKVRNISRYFGLITEYEAIAKDKGALAYAVAAEALQEAGDAPEAGEADASQDEVQVMTIHKAKGLEFETVYLFDMSRGTFPSNRRSETLQIPDELLTAKALGEGDWHIQEERRLMYVAMTRAKQNLVLTWSHDHGGKRAKQPSVFIKEALAIEPPKPAAKSLDSTLEQIKLFQVDQMQALPLKPRFMQGATLQLTPHQIDDYLTCPANFHYNYVLEVPQPPKPALMYGTMIHSIINQYYMMRSKGKVDVEQLIGMIPSLWKSDGFISKGEEQRRLAQAKQTIRDFAKREEAAKVLPKYLEREFIFELPELDVKVKGRFDAIYEYPDGSTEIRDYKTSQVDDEGKADDKAKSSIQLAVYALAWQKISGKLPDRVVLDFVETKQEGTAVKTEADMEKLNGQIAEVAEGIRAGRFQVGKNCYYCVHRKAVLADA